jgi:hypothetical protein
MIIRVIRLELCDHFKVGRGEDLGDSLRSNYWNMALKM